MKIIENKRYKKENEEKSRKSDLNLIEHENKY